jgi:type III restriction enzyme
MKFTLKDYQADAVRDALENLKKARKDWHGGPTRALFR